MRKGGRVLVLGIVGSLVLTACTTFREIAALSAVDFALGGVSGGTLAGVPVQTRNDLGDLGPLELARIGASLSNGELPLEATVGVLALNPETNVQARLVGLEWTLFLDDRRTVSGALEDEYVLSPGRTTTVPVRVELDLLDFFDDQLEEVVELALAVAGAGEPQRIRLEAIPTIQTPLGPIRYPTPVRIEATLE